MVMSTAPAAEAGLQRDKIHAPVPHELQLLELEHRQYLPQPTTLHSWFCYLTEQKTFCCRRCKLTKLLGTNYRCTNLNAASTQVSMLVTAIAFSSPLSNPPSKRAEFYLCTEVPLTVHAFTKFFFIWYDEYAQKHKIYDLIKITNNKSVPSSRTLQVCIFLDAVKLQI